MTYFEGIQILTLTDPTTNTHAHTHSIAPTPTHKLISAPNPPCLPPNIPTDRGGRCIGICLYCPIFYPFYPAFSSAPLPACLSVCLQHPSPSFSPPEHCNVAETKVSDCVTASHMWIRNESRPWLHTHTHTHTTKTPFSGMIWTGVMHARGDSVSWFETRAIVLFAWESQILWASWHQVN